MKISESLKVFDAGWVRKSKGYRVHFQKKVDNEFITDHVPNLEDNPVDSDVVAWRIAWKLYQTTKSGAAENSEPEFVNIYVVDDLGSPVKFYVTNQLKVYNSKTVD